MAIVESRVMRFARPGCAKPPVNSDTLAIMNPQQVIDEARLMLEDVLPRIGLYQTGEQFDPVALRESFSQWAESQEVADADFAFMVLLVGAFVSEYLKDARSASLCVSENKILIRVPVESGIAREFDPYAVAADLVRNRKSLSEFLAHVLG